MSLGLHASAEIMINNAGFEDPEAGNPAGWGVGGVDLADVSSDVALEGSQSLKFTAPPVFEQQTEVFQGVVGGSGDDTTPLQFTANLYTPSAEQWADAFFVLGIEFKKQLEGGGDVFVSGGEMVIVPESITADQWNTFNYELTAAGEWDFLVLKLKTIGVGGSGGSGVIYADAVSAQVPEPSSLALTGVGTLLALSRKRRLA